MWSLVITILVVNGVARGFSAVEIESIDGFKGKADCAAASEFYLSHSPKNTYIKSMSAICINNG